MLNTNLNLIGISSFDRFSQEESRGYIPFRLQYVLVPGGGGSAAGNNSFLSGSDLPKIGVAGSGGVIVTGSYCVEPFISYAITIGKGGAGGTKSTTSPIWTGSNGGDTIAFGVTVPGGEGGKSQFYITASGFAGNGSGTSASIANGGSGSLWAYNLPGPPFPDGYGGGGTGGDYITNNYYAGGGAGINVSQSYASVIIDYLIVGGGGAGESKTATAGVTTAAGGGGGAVISSSYNFQADPSSSSYLVGTSYVFPIVVGQGGSGSANLAGGKGSSSSVFGFSAEGGFGGSGSLPSGNSGTGSANSNFTTGFLGALGGGAGARQGGSGSRDLGGGNYDGGAGGDGALWSGSYFGGGHGGVLTPGAGTTFNGANGQGVSNYGGGGAGKLDGSAGGNGVNGVVKIKYLTSLMTELSITGGTITQDEFYTTHTFTSSSNLTISTTIPKLEVEYVVVGGGGSGPSFAAGTFNENFWGAGGGGGGVVSGSFICEPIVNSYPIIVGAGGYKPLTPNSTGGNGSGSYAFGSSASGGASGSIGNNPGFAGANGTGSWGNTTLYPGVFGLAAGGSGAGNSGSIGTTNPSAPLRKGGSGGKGLPWVNGMVFGGGGPGSWWQGGDGPYIGTYGQNSELLFNLTQYPNFYPGRGGAGLRGNIGTPDIVAGEAGQSGSVIIRYPGTGSKATGGDIIYSGSYTYHIFTASGNFVLNESTSSLFTSGLPGTGSLSYFSTSGSTQPQAYVGGGGAASYYNQNGVSGSDGVVVLRYEGAPLADGGQIITTQYYTYHVFTSSANLEVFGYESNPNVNPC